MRKCRASHGNRSYLYSLERGRRTEGSSWKSWQVWFWQCPLSVLCLAMVFEKQSRSGAAQKRDDVGTPHVVA
jgi:hypothetical protein